MRSELNEIQLIDQYLLRQLPAAEAQAFETRILCNGPLAERVEAQRIAHRLIRLFARKQERRRLETIYRQLQAEPSFARQLKTIFA
ncbi:MAG TPA: hypothetical protein VHE34_24150 [Puia sp.]|uniref:hypothetical protein n=1 Tax=Puia sp. TaxID=2045100 RepID=UPI002C53AD61|nr:hypothetical protein [Puia sp.]HVU98347.1 hypothetical protein [Puia sp.]